MPKIQAPTVAEHRAAQRAALLEAAREILGPLLLMRIAAALLTSLIVGLVAYALIALVSPNQEPSETIRVALCAGVVIADCVVGAGGRVRTGSWSGGLFGAPENQRESDSE